MRWRIEEARQTIALIDTCYREFADYIDAVFEALRLVKVELYREFEVKKGEMEREIAVAEKEVWKSLEAGSTAHISPLTAALLSIKPGRLTAFTYSIERKDIAPVVKNCLKTFFTPYEIVTSPVAVFSDQWVEFDLTLHRWKQPVHLEREITVDADSSVVTIDKSRLFVFGGRLNAPYSTGPVHSLGSALHASWSCANRCSVQPETRVHLRLW